MKLVSAHSTGLLMGLDVVQKVYRRLRGLWSCGGGGWCQGSVRLALRAGEHLSRVLPSVPFH